jgi:hypothetical protein
MFFAANAGPDLGANRRAGFRSRRRNRDSKTCRDTESVMGLCGMIRSDGFRPAHANLALAGLAGIFRSVPVAGRGIGIRLRIRSRTT